MREEEDVPYIEEAITLEMRTLKKLGLTRSMGEVSEVLAYEFA